VGQPAASRAAAGSGRGCASADGSAARQSVSDAHFGMRFSV
jgi:hypothetical protein